MSTGRALGALALAISLASCGSSNSPSSPSNPSSPAPAANVTITITGENGSMSFSPTPGSAKVGQTVAWHNADSIGHTASANNGSWDTGLINPGSTSSPITMSTAGSFGYHCNVHPSMVSTLQVQ